MVQVPDHLQRHVPDVQVVMRLQGKIEAPQQLHNRHILASSANSAAPITSSDLMPEEAAFLWPMKVARELESCKDGSRFPTGELSANSHH